MHFDRRLWNMIEGLQWRVVLATVIGLLGVPVAIVRLMVTASALFAVFQGEPFEEIVPLLVLIAFLIVLRSAIEFTRDEIADRTAAIMKVRLREQIYRHVRKLGAGYFDQRRTGDAVNTLVESVEQLDVFFGRYLPLLITALVTPFFLFILLVRLDFITACIFFFFALFTLFAPYVFRHATEGASTGRRIAYNKFNADYLDSLQGLSTLKIFGESGRRGKMLAKGSWDVFHKTMHVLTINIGVTGITMLGITAGSAIAMSWGAIRVQDGELGLRTLLVALMLGVEVFRPLQLLTRAHHQGMNGQAAANAIYELLDTEPEIQDSARATTPATFTPELQFADVTFGYHGGNRIALKHCSFTLASGETLGVVGPSGAGKSTIVSLLMRFVDPQEGDIQLSGVNLRNLPLAYIRDHVAVVTQDTYLFDGTIADNLRIGRPNAALEEMKRAARLANVDSVIDELPDGYDTHVGERGTRLSGGQRQRIAIARALLKDAPILVLDEALSSVDTENETLIQQALDRLQRGRTTLVIAHRLSSVINADRIIVLDQGQVVEEGTHPQLIERDGIYAALVAAQRDIEAEQAAEAGMQFTAPAHRSVMDREDDDTFLRETESSTNSNRQWIPFHELAWRLLKLVKPWPGELSLVVLAGFLHAMSMLAVGVIGALLVGKVVTGGNINPYIWTLLALIPLTGLFTWLDLWLQHDLAYRLLAEMRITLYNILDRLSPAYLYRNRSGDLLATATGDVELIELFYAHTLVPSMLSVLVPTGVLVAIAFIDPRLALILLPFLIAVGLTPFFSQRHTEKLGIELRDFSGTLNAYMVDSVQGLRTIAVYSYGEIRTREVGVMGQRLSHLKHKMLQQQSIQVALIESLTGLGSLAVLTLGAWIVSGGELQRTSLPIATVLALTAFGPVASIATVARELAETNAAARRYFAIEDEPVPVTDGPIAELAPGTTLSAASAIAFESVSFRYDTGDRPALRDVSFVVEPGQTIALVGSSGAGKTTIGHLLLRFWDPQWGRITFYGNNIKEFELDSLRRKIALVSQDTYLFHTTLLENLRLGNPTATDEEVFAAASQANVDNFVALMPDGYDTIVGERGLQLSGGQRQRVAIARALLKDAPILILDEATSHLDAVNELEIRESLDRLRSGRTTLVIAHRLSTIRNADKIMVLDEGRLVEAGSHRDLLALDGYYSHLIASQLRGWEASANVGRASAD